MTDRPTCHVCGRPLHASRYHDGRRGYGGHGVFCGLRCGYDFGRAVVEGIAAGRWRLVRVHDAAADAAELQRIAGKPVPALQVGAQRTPRRFDPAGGQEP